jgi:hypothetical protein
MTTSKDRTPDWLLERLALGELDAAAAADVRGRLAAEGRDADAELAALAASNREILEAHPPARIAAAVRARANAARPARRWLAIAPLVLAGAAAVVLVARPHRTTSTTTTGTDEVGLEDATPKGPAALGVYRHRADGDERLSDGASAAPGDLLQLTYRAGTDRFGVLLSIDGRGHVTLHWPDTGESAATRLSGKGEVRLPSAYELDDAPGFERFFLVTAEAPFAVATAADAARALAAKPDAARITALALPADLHQLSLTLAKSGQTARKETP